MPLRASKQLTIRPAVKAFPEILFFCGGWSLSWGLMTPFEGGWPEPGFVTAPGWGFAPLSLPGLGAG
jgi:hypothetical protein